MDGRGGWIGEGNGVGDVLAVAYVVEQGGEVDGAQVEGRLEGWLRAGVDVVGERDDSLDVVPGMLSTNVSWIFPCMRCIRKQSAVSEAQ